VLGREVVEGQQHRAILGQALGRLGIFDPIGLDEQIEGLLGIRSRGCHPDLMRLLLGFRL
jgi:hypothetical protein